MALKNTRAKVVQRLYKIAAVFSGVPFVDAYIRVRRINEIIAVCDRAETLRSELTGHPRVKIADDKDKYWDRYTQYDLDRIHKTAKLSLRQFEFVARQRATKKTVLA